MRSLLIISLLLLKFHLLSSQDEHLDKIENIFFHEIKSVSTVDSLKQVKLLENYQAYLKTIKDIRELKYKRSFSGKALLGFNGETTRDDNNSLFNIYGGINLDWDLYPGELDFYTSFGVTFSDGGLQENVSRIDISYDYLQTNVSNGLFLENYVFINRSTDAYLGIDQRYEIGGGIILNNWIKKLIAPANERFPKPIKSKAEENDWKLLLAKRISEDEFDLLQADYQEAYNKHRKAKSKLRVALLTGVFFELQETTINDSIDLEATYHFRWGIRPTMDISLRDGWKISLRPYFKMPMPWEWQDIIEDGNGRQHARADLLVDFTARLSTQLASKRVEIGFIYNLVYDNAPPRIFYTNENNSSELLVNNDLHQSFRMNMTVSLAR